MAFTAQISYAGSVPLRSNSTTQAYTYAGNAPASDEVNTGSTYGGPEYHVGRRYSQQELVGSLLTLFVQMYCMVYDDRFQRRSPRVSQSSLDGSESTLRRMSIHEGPYEDERGSVYQEPPAPPPQQRGPPVHRNSYVSSYGGPGPDYSGGGGGGGGYYDYPHRGMQVYYIPGSWH